jgi:hypothetical protein
MGAMVLIGIVIAAGAFASMHDYRMDRNTLFQERAIAAAEEGQARILRDWSTAWNTMAVGDTLPPKNYTMADGSSARVIVTRLNTNTFWVMSDGAANQTSRQLNARRRTNLILRLNVPNFRIPGAISAREATRAAGTTTINGNDNVPAGWNCDDAGPPAAAIAADSAGDIGVTGTCGSDACLSSSAPSPRGVDTLLRDTSSFSQYGGLNYDSLKAQALTGGAGKVADVTSTRSNSPTTFSGIGPRYNMDGSCNKTDPLNWGDPNRNAVTPGKCEDYFPVVYLRSGVNNYVTVSGGVGQGILIVDGNLTLAGTLSWYGPIIVRGTFTAAGSGGGTGVTVIGGVLAASMNCDSSNPVTTPCNDISGNSHIQFSRCAISSAVSRNARTVLATRSWADLF